jgi:hypothetical protein
VTSSIFGGNLSRQARWPILAAAFMCMVTLLVLAYTAVAAEAKSLTITNFTLQTTKTVKVSGPLSHDSYGFVNEPYSFVQAAGHPANLSAAFEFESEEIGSNGPTPTRDPKDVAVGIPPGLVGNPTAVPRCPLKLALANEPCPPGTQVGIAVLYALHGEGFVGPIVNVTPEAGQSAEFAIETSAKLNFLVTAHVARTREGYGITVVDNGIANSELVKVETTFWGVPASDINDPERGLLCTRAYGSTYSWGCGITNPKVNNGEEFGRGGEKSGDAEEVPFLTMPSDCSIGPEVATIKADSWEEPGSYNEAQTTMPGVAGCDLLQFNPGIEVKPDTLLADAPVALDVGLTVPQFEEPQTLATPEMRSALLTLPVGMSISPGIVDGIQACNESGPEGINFEGALSEEEGLNGELQLAPGRCPDASIVGTAEAETPLLEVPIKGHIYLARPGCGGSGQRECTEQDALDGDLYQLYLELGGTGTLADTGVNIKVRLKTEANPATGQLTTVTSEIAQLPFSKLKIDLNGGPRAPLDTPPTCGYATTTADFAPWAAPGLTPQGMLMQGVPDATPLSYFDVEGCPESPGLTPGFVAGTVTPNAGKFSSFTLNLTRQDREQYIKGIQVHTPPGLLGMLSSVQLCGEPEADIGNCSESSKIGTTRVASGAGSHPFELEGNVYLTGPYGGSPFGLSIVVHVTAGPFDLGVKVVRARIAVDPVNSTLTITTDESGAYSVPQIVFGVPVRLKRVTVDIDRPNFMFNPTNCSSQQVGALVSGSNDAVARVSSPFAVGGCKSLVFNPTFKVWTSSHTSRTKGAALDVKLSYPTGALGNDANIARVKVSLPKQLPSRLTTLQKACPARQFESNPADCPSPSIVGIARSNSPLLPVGLSGPVYFVSHGGESFPSLIVVLQGDNVRIDLTGTTFINKAGITSSTFKAVPDVPVNSFELYLPEGKFSALAANGNLCKIQNKLKMPTEFVAQDGAVIKKSIQITVTGCLKQKQVKGK